MGDKTKVVLVTGGSSGIGQAAALEFAKLGYKIAITGRNQKRLDSTIEQLLVASQEAENCNSASKGEHFLAINADFEDELQVDAVVPAVIAKFHRLDILINNAGYVGQSHDLLDDQFYEDFQKILQVNLMSAVRLSQLAAPHLIGAEHTNEDPGILINVSSVGDRVAFRAMAYCVSKAGLSMLTKTLANSLEGRPVRVLTVAPGPVLTQISPDVRVIQHMGEHATLLGRPAHSQEVANLIVFLCSAKASYMHGSTVDIDGGNITKLGLLITEGLGKKLIPEGALRN